MVPPVINKYYITDIAPGRSMIEYFVGQGQQVFTLSWRNPDAEHRDWNLDTYGAAILDAIDAVDRDHRHRDHAPAGQLLGRDPGRDDRRAPDRIGHGDRVAGLTLAVSVLVATAGAVAAAGTGTVLAHPAAGSSRRCDAVYVIIDLTVSHNPDLVYLEVT